MGLILLTAILVAAATADIFAGMIVFGVLGYCWWCLRSPGGGR